MRLEELLFYRTKAELEAFRNMDNSYYEDEKECQRERFCSLWQVIEEAELVDEYEEWVNAGNFET